MTGDLYERYKEALRVGHVAVLRGTPEEAIDAYLNAALIAPSRALPHTSLGGVLLRLGRVEEALVEYAAAVERAPHDEGALLGQADALTIAGQRVAAAKTLEHVSEIQEAAGRLPEAADTLRRALELEAGPERSRHQRGLMREIRLSAGDQAAERQLARALRILDEPGAVTEPGRSGYAPGPIQARMGAAAASRGAVLRHEPLASVKPAQSVRTYLGNSPTPPSGTAPAEPVTAEVEGTVAPAEPTGLELAVAEAEPSLAALPQVAEPAAEAAAAPAGIGVMEGAFDAAALPGSVGESEHQPGGDELLAAAEAAEAAEPAGLAGDNPALRSLLLGTARAYAREGRFDAALDATHRLLQRSPGDVDAHIVLVELYVARDWNELAADKLVLLGRLADLNGDEDAHRRLCAVASSAFPKNERLGALCS